MAGSLPQDKSTLLIFYCGGVECMLSHNSAFKAEKLGYTNVRVYADGSPDWAAKGTGQAVSAAYIKKLLDEKANFMLIDARPKRVFDKGSIPGAVNISDTDFDKQVDKLPADKATPLIYYCGGVDCVLSVKSADKARKLGYTDVKTLLRAIRSGSSCTVKQPLRPQPAEPVRQPRLRPLLRPARKRHHHGCVLRTHHEGKSGFPAAGGCA